VGGNRCFACGEPGARRGVQEEIRHNSAALRPFGHLLMRFAHPVGAAYGSLSHCVRLRFPLEHPLAPAFLVSMVFASQKALLLLRQDDLRREFLAMVRRPNGNEPMNANALFEQALGLGNGWKVIGSIQPFSLPAAGMRSPRALRIGEIHCRAVMLRDARKEILGERSATQLQWGCKRAMGSRLKPFQRLACGCRSFAHFRTIVYVKAAKLTIDLRNFSPTY